MPGSRPRKILSKRVAKSFYQFNPQIGFWGTPNVECEVSFEQNKGRQITVRHNAEGNRDVLFEKRNSKDAILCMGGSHTWGGGVEQELRFSDRLAARTKKRVVNLGHCSFGLDQICLAILQRSKKYSPSIIVVEQYPWAIHRVLSTYVNGYIRPYFYLDSDQSLKLQKMPRLARYKFARRVMGSFYEYRKELLECKAGISLKDGYDPLSDPIFLYWKVNYYDYMYNLVDKILIVMSDYCRQNSIRLFFALGAIAQQFGPKSPSSLVDYDLPRKRLIQLLEKNGIAFVDMTDVMLKEHSEDDPVIFPDGHINAKGNDIFARVIQEELEELGWLTK